VLLSMVRLRSKSCLPAADPRPGGDDEERAPVVWACAAAAGPPSDAAGECGVKDQVSRRGLEETVTLRAAPGGAPGLTSAFEPGGAAG